MGTGVFGFVVVGGKYVGTGVVGLVVGRGVVVVVVVVSFLTHWQSQSAIPLEVAKENAELSPSRRAKNPLSSANFRGFADMALNWESLITPIKVFLSTSIETTLDPTVASS